jgi:hypothetical protein
MDKFDYLSETDRINDIIYILDRGYYSLAITLTSGDVILGDQDPDLEVQYLPHSKNYKDRADYNSLKEFERPISNHMVLLFPDGSGMVYGHAYAVIIPVTLIARIQGIEPLININKEKMTFYHPGGSLALRNLPNPLSESIRDRNCEIIKRLGLRWCVYNEEALSGEAISGNNITFSDYQWIYADWEYFKNINGGIRNIGGTAFGFGVSGGKIISNQDLAITKLYEDSCYKGVIREDPEKQFTNIEGDKVQLYHLQLYGRTPHVSMPILIKEKCIIYPKEFINCINSELTVFGEVNQIPIHLNGTNYKSCLLARAIAFIPCKGDIA